MTRRRPLPVRATAVAAALVAGFAAIPLARAAEPGAPELLRQYDCNICHGEREAKAGPSYVEIGNRYRRQPNAVDRIAVKVTRGAHGDALWHMPPHPEVSRAHARSMARYILSRTSSDGE